MPLEEFLPYRLSVLANRVSQSLSRLYADRFDLTVGEWRVMAILAGEPGLSANRVAARAAMDKVQVSRAVHRLLRRRRLERHRDPGDRRRSVLRLSDEGARIYREIVPAAREFERSLLDALAGPDRAVLDDLLRRLAAQVPVNER